MDNTNLPVLWRDPQASELSIIDKADFNNEGSQLQLLSLLFKKSESDDKLIQRRRILSKLNPNYDKPRECMLAEACSSENLELARIALRQLTKIEGIQIQRDCLRKVSRCAAFEEIRDRAQRAINDLHNVVVFPDGK